MRRILIALCLVTGIGFVACDVYGFRQTKRLPSVELRTLTKKYV